jgi:hypothetical protein
MTHLTRAEWDAMTPDARRALLSQGPAWIDPPPGFVPAPGRVPPPRGTDAAGDPLPYYEDEDCPYKHCRLVFPKSWIGTRLPAQWQHPVDHPDADQRHHFLIELEDTEDGGKIYTARSWPSYHGDDSAGWGPDDPRMTHLHIYTYQEHYCACHRKSDAEAAGAGTDDECEGERFAVRSITAPEHLPGVVLYSETLTAEELTPKLAGWLPPA